jgi:hypothetical protein
LNVSDAIRFGDAFSGVRASSVAVSIGRKLPAARIVEALDRCRRAAA